MRNTLRNASFLIAAWICLCCVSLPFAAAADTIADGDSVSDDQGSAARVDQSTVPSATEAIKRWLNPSSVEPNSSSPVELRNSDVVDLCRRLFRDVGPSCESAPFGSVRSSAFLLSRTVNALIERGNSIGDAARVLPLFLALESCSGRDVDASSLLNFAAFPKIYQHSVRRLGVHETEDSMRVLWDVFHQKKSDETHVLLESVVSHKHWSGPKWDAFVELAGYNLALLQYHDGHVAGARRTHEAIVTGEGQPRTWNEALREQAAAVRSQVKASLENDSTKPLVILTSASDPNRPELDALLRSAERVVMEDGSSPEVRVLGSGRPFPGTYAKVGMLLAETAAMHPDQLVLFLDAYDTLLFPSVRELPGMYRRGALTRGEFRSVVFGAERGKAPYPDPGLGPLFDGDNDGPIVSLNSGTILGTASTLSDMAAEVASYPSVLGSDQRGYSRYYLTHRDEVGMDLDGRAFLTLHALPQSSHINLVTGQLKSDIHVTTERTEETEVRPAVVHGNGGNRSGKEYYRRITAVAAEAATFPWATHLGSSEGTEGAWVTVRPPPFTFAGLAEDGLLDLDDVLGVFRDYVRGERGGGARDVEALMYLAGKLAARGEVKEAQAHLDAAVRADGPRATELYERALRGGGSLF